ncbi:hypothetical protein KC19_VG072000 [Ceratodon purpureus]|uniref:Uncharacterized protein n=1 Tax=Ceratodon purpureus TaxID=3225 RepID=A0A8T0HMV0_CERPU|nr:hypothetical protein KC19_VG072000 [Ceratodon purpureus]
MIHISETCGKYNKVLTINWARHPLLMDHPHFFLESLTPFGRDLEDAEFAFVPKPYSNGVASSGSTTSLTQLCVLVGPSTVSQSADSIGPMSSTAGGFGVAAVTQSGKNGDG